MSFFLGTFLFCLLEAAFVGYVYTTTKTAPHQTRLYAPQPLIPARV